MKSHKLTLSALALSIVMTCSLAYAQDAPAPDGGDGPNAAATQNPRENYRPLSDGAKQIASETSAPVGPEPKSSAIYKTFTSGAGATLFRWSISAHGNVVRLESPLGFEHLAAGAIGEGYVLSMNSSIGVIRYFDAGYTESTGCSGNVRSWSPTVFEQNATANGTTLIRDTCDGLWRLTQTFTRNAANHELTITMSLRNIAPFAQSNVRLDRYFDADLDGDNSDDFFTRTADAVAGQEGTLDNLSLTALTFNVSHATAIHSFAGWVPSINNQATLASPTGVGDFVGRVSYNLGTINANAAKSVKVLYKRQ